MKRRAFLANSGGILAGAAGILPLAHGADDTAAAMAENEPAHGFPWQVPRLAPIHASPDRIMVLNLCTRPFRAAGPRQELEKMGRKQVIHNYGHGGSGWSLSWGSADLATDMALATGQKQVAVIGCGALGMTTAVMAQRKGMAVTIYTDKLPPFVRSAFATGIWSPESRICTKANADAFAASWERQARFSHRMYQNLMGLPGYPVEWRDNYQLSDNPFGTPSDEESGEPEYPDFSKTLTPDLTPVPQDLAAGTHPFPVPFARYAPLLQFNITHYSRLLLDDFYQAGGALEIARFDSARDFNALDERTLINCTGYGARELLGDDSIIPVRGQTAKLIPQPEVDYGIRYGSGKVYVYPRRDGLLVQAQAEGDFNNASTAVNADESRSAVLRLQTLMQETMANQQRGAASA